MFSLLNSPHVRAVLFQSVFLPAALAVAILLCFRLMNRVLPTSFGTALAFAAALCLGAWQEVMPCEPGLFAWQWLPCVTLLALAIGLVTAVLPARAIPWILRAATAGLAGWLLVPSDLRATAWWAVPALTIVILALSAVLHRLARSTAGAQTPLAMALPFLAAFVIILHAHCGRLAEEALIIAGTLMGMAVAARWMRVDCTGAVPGASVFLPGVLLAGQTETYSDVPASAFLVAALAPLVVVLTLLPGQNRWPHPRLVLLRFLLLLAPLAYALFLAVRAESIDLE